MLKLGSIVPVDMKQRLRFQPVPCISSLAVQSAYPFLHKRSEHHCSLWVKFLCIAQNPSLQVLAAQAARDTGHALEKKHELEIECQSLKDALEACKQEVSATQADCRTLQCKLEEQAVSQEAKLASANAASTETWSIQLRQAKVLLVHTLPFPLYCYVVDVAICAQRCTLI